MVNLYYYFFYSFYEWNYKLLKDKTIPFLSAIFCMSYVMMLCYVMIMDQLISRGIVDRFFGLDFNLGLIVTLVVFIFNYLFLRNKKNDIIKEYNGQPVFKRRIYHAVSALITVCLLFYYFTYALR